ncbi:MAG: TolC family protein [Planctomycetaceae bacterium]|nr:TolC family protein [Planctomycetaceae bacterium]
MAPKLLSPLAVLALCIIGCTAVPVGRRNDGLAQQPTKSASAPAPIANAGHLPPQKPASPADDSPVSLASSPTRRGQIEASDEQLTPVSAARPGSPTDIVIVASAVEPAPPPPISTEVETGAYTLSLSNVLHLADSQNPNVAVARERIHEAYARVEQAETLWIPSLRAGLNYNHHEGSIQDVAGRVFNTNRSSFYGGMGANAVGAGSPAVPGIVAQFHLTDAIFQPKIAAHQASARQFGATAARNDTLRDAAVAYLELVRAEHALAIAREAVANTQKLTDLTRQYAETGQGLQSDHQRLEAELALRKEELVAGEEGVQVASARLAQVLHADPSVVIQSGEPTVIPLQIVTLDGGPASYVATGLSRRPELAEQKHLVCEAVERLRREKFAPLVPSVLLGMSYGGMGGGFGSSIVNSDDRWDADAVAYWEIRNLGFGERAARKETSSLQRQAQMRELAILDLVAREVAEAHAQVTNREQRIELTQRGLEAARKSYSLNLQRIENAQGLPIETLQSIQALANSQRAYLNAVVDYNIAQFELSRAIGWFVES